MKDTDLNYHLHSNIERILLKWRPTLGLVRVKYRYTDDSLTEIISKYCEWWEVVKSNYDGLYKSIEFICEKLNKSNSDLTNYSIIIDIFGYDFAKVYDIQQYRNNQIEKLYESNRR